MWYMTDFILAFAWIAILTIVSGIAKSESLNNISIKKPKKVIVSYKPSIEIKKVNEDCRNIEEEIKVLGEDIIAIIQEI